VVPAFAKVPYAPFSRSAAIAIATREWMLFGQPVGDEPPAEPPPEKPERVQGLWQRVGEYWWLGMNDGAPEQRWTGKHDAAGRVFPPSVDGDYAWSAAFVSYVMRIAGAGPLFPYAASHSTYIDIAAKGDRHYAVQAEDPAIYAAVPGDLICTGRDEASHMRFADLPAGSFPSHCDIVVEVDPGVLSVIGGNVGDAVTLKHVPVSDTGLLAAADGTPIDTRYDWFVVIRVGYLAE
jgi:hypothetical protein